MENSNIYKEETAKHGTVTGQRGGPLCERERHTSLSGAERGREANVRTAQVETHTNVPACCLTCGYYLPQFHTVVGKQCAAFGTVQGVKWDRCGAWTPRALPPRA